MTGNQRLIPLQIPDAKCNLIYMSSEKGDGLRELISKTASCNVSCTVKQIHTNAHILHFISHGMSNLEGTLESRMLQHRILEQDGNLDHRLLKVKVILKLQNFRT